MLLTFISHLLMAEEVKGQRHHILPKEVTVHGPHVGRETSRSTFVRMKDLQTLLGILLHGDVSLLPYLFTYSIMYLH